jgi:hypothetical protein
VRRERRAGHRTVLKFDLEIFLKIKKKLKNLGMADDENKGGENPELLEEPVGGHC